MLILLTFLQCRITSTIIQMNEMIFFIIYDTLCCLFYSKLLCQLLIVGEFILEEITDCGTNKTVDDEQTEAKVAICNEQNSTSVGML